MQRSADAVVHWQPAPILRVLSTFGRHAGNYKDGALLPGTRDCDYNMQFEEKRCRMELQFTIEACGGALTVSYEWGSPPLDVACGEAARGRLALYSVGNHPVEGACHRHPLGGSELSLFYFCIIHRRCISSPPRAHIACSAAPHSSTKPLNAHRAAPCRGHRQGWPLPAAMRGAARAASCGRTAITRTRTGRARAGVTEKESPGQGRNSVPHYTAVLQRGAVCPFAAAHADACRLWWVTTHQRLNSMRHDGFPLEGHHHIRSFN